MFSTTHNSDSIPKKKHGKTKKETLRNSHLQKKLVAKDSVSGPIHPAFCWSLKMISRKPSIVEKSFVSPSCTAKGTAPFIQYGKFSCKPPSTSWPMLICSTNVLLMLPSSLSCTYKKTGGNKWMNLPNQIMALINVKHAELNSWITPVFLVPNGIFLLNALQKFCSLHQGTAKPPIQVELATFGQKSGRCEVSALACLKLPRQKLLKGWWIGNIKGQKRLIKRIKVLKTQGSSDVHM